MVYICILHLHICEGAGWNMMMRDLYLKYGRKRDEIEFSCCRWHQYIAPTTTCIYDFCAQACARANLLKCMHVQYILINVCDINWYMYIDKFFCDNVHIRRKSHVVANIHCCKKLQYVSLYRCKQFVTYRRRYTWFRVSKTHRMPYLYRSFSAEEPYN